MDKLFKDVVKCHFSFHIKNSHLNSLMLSF